jgi:hypothetical protein
MALVLARLTKQQREETKKSKNRLLIIVGHAIEGKIIRDQHPGEISKRKR